MKTVIFRNRLNDEKVQCQDTKKIKVIDGVEYLSVYRVGQNNRPFLMRKEVLEKVNVK
jgi:hypothetical protein